MADFSGGVFKLNDNKAGLSQLEGGLSKEAVSRILTKASEGSAFFENKKRRQKMTDDRIAAKRAQLERAMPDEIEEVTRKCDKILQDLEQNRDLSHTIVHVDMDMFYAAVEMRDNPSLKDKPLAVGSNSMLSTSNYIARKYGVRAAQPGFLARKLCPNLVIVPCNFDKYRAVAKVVRGVFAEYDPHFSSFSLDEAYLDITNHLSVRISFPEVDRTFWRCDCQYYSSINQSAPFAEEKDANLNNEALENKEERCPNCRRTAEKLVFDVDAEGAVAELRLKVFQRTSLTCSAGISVNSMLAKICTDKNKPDGQYRLPPDRNAIMEFIRDLPVRKIPGIGATTEQMLNAFDVKTCHDLYLKRHILALAFSELSLEHFLRVSLGLGSTSLGGDEERKSISTERTFRELSKPEDLFAKLKELVEDLVQDMEEEAICGKCVTLKLKLVTFEVLTRAHSVPNPIRKFDEIFPVAKKVLENEIKKADGKLRLRLMGVRMSNLVSVSELEPLQQKTLSQFVQKSDSSTSAPKELRLKRFKREASEDVKPVLVKADSGSSGDSSETVFEECPRCGDFVETDPLGNDLTVHIAQCRGPSMVEPKARTDASAMQNSCRPQASTSKKSRKGSSMKITDFMVRNKS